MITKTYVYITSAFTGYHRWVNAPASVSFLKDYHRHIFCVKLIVKVSHQDRDVEFFRLKEDLDVYLRVNFYGNYFEFSCEQIAERIIDEMTHLGYCVYSCEVSEDGENGAIVVVADNQ